MPLEQDKKDRRNARRRELRAQRKADHQAQKSDPYGLDAVLAEVERDANIIQGQNVSEKPLSRSQVKDELNIVIMLMSQNGSYFGMSSNMQEAYDRIENLKKSFE